MTFGSLFAGIGGMDLGLERAGMTCVWQVEINDYCRRVLEKHWPDVRRHDDVRTFPPAGDWRCDLIAGGFPCIDISSSGKKEGIRGSQSGLWTEFARVVRILRPKVVVVENVADVVHRGMGAILGELAGMGFDAQWACLPAAAFGSPQRRWRMFVVANHHCRGQQRREEWHGYWSKPQEWNYIDGLALAERRASEASSRIRRVDDGIPRWVDRIRGLGNAVVPQVAEWIGRRIMEANNPVA